MVIRMPDGPPSSTLASSPVSPPCVTSMAARRAPMTVLPRMTPPESRSSWNPMPALSARFSRKVAVQVARAAYAATSANEASFR